MSPRNKVFISRIESELAELDEVVKRVMSAWHYAMEQRNDLFLDATALNLHGFYSGIERIFESIAKEIDQSVPSGLSWHRELAYQMTMEIDSVRPPVITKATCKMLDEYRGFRHVVRNVYTYNLSEDRLRDLVAGLESGYAQVKRELGTFLANIA